MSGKSRCVPRVCWLLLLLVMDQMMSWVPGNLEGCGGRVTGPAKVGRCAGPSLGHTISPYTTGWAGLPGLGWLDSWAGLGWLGWAG